jgi:hypothetical protein
MEAATKIRLFPKIILSVLFCASLIFAETADSDSLLFEKEHKLSIVGIILPHNSLKNSETLHSWPFFAFPAPAWLSNYKWQKPGKLATIKGSAAGEANFAGLGLKLDISVELIHLLELGIQANGGTALNYGKTSTFMGVYDAEERNYHQDIIFTEYAYGFTYKSSLTLPLLVLLPKSNWTKIILKLSGEYAYSAYTGANDGEVWKAGNGNMVNGFHYKCGGTLIYMMPFKRVPMAMLSASASGFKHEYDFDETYKDYNPGFVTVNITPMASIKVSEKWNGMLMASVSRDRVFENRRYPTTEELLQKQVDSEWDLRAVMFILSRKF